MMAKPRRGYLKCKKSTNHRDMTSRLIPPIDEFLPQNVGFGYYSTIKNKQSL